MPVKKGRKSVKTDDNTIGTTDTDLTTNDTNSDDVPKIKPVINALFKQKKVREAKSTDFENTDDDEKLKNIKGKKRETFADRKKDESKGKKSKKRKETTVQATNIETVQEVEEEVPIEPLDVTAEDVEAIFNTVSTGEAPIDISIDYENFGQVTMSSLQWSNLAAVPVALKLTNTSHSLVITGKWPVAEMPYISGGPLLEDYVFSQIHYHWGGVVRQYDIEQKKDTLWIMAGSEHTIENEQFPLEMHAVFHRRSCGSHEAAKRAHNGIAIVVYLCADITEDDNPYLTPVTKTIYRVMQPYTSYALDIAPLNTLLPTFYDDYIIYKGYLKFKCNHDIIWIITRNTFFVSLFQLCKFQEVMDAQGRPITNPFHETNPLDDRPILHVNPSSKYDAFIHFRDTDLKAVEEALNDVQKNKKPSADKKKKKQTLTAGRKGSKIK